MERAEIEHRLDLDEAAQLTRLRRFADGEDAPRKARAPAGEHLVHGIACHGHGPSQIIEIELPVLHSHQAERERAEGSPETRVRGERAEDGIGLHETVRQPGNLAGRQV